MCGILGFVTKKNDNINYHTHLIKDLNSVLDHRGPDSKNFLIADNKMVYIGHNRLSIQDLSINGSQPMQIKNGKFIISYNGEIYNHYDLRKKLDNISTHKWQSSCDTETLLLCFEKWGVDKTLDNLDGMFSIILYNKISNTLYLIRDRYGEKPLYYGKVDNLLVFSSELKVFRRIPNFNNRISKKAIKNYLSYNFIPTPISIYKNIFKVDQGNYIKFELNKTYDINSTEQVSWFNPSELIDINYQKELSLLSKSELINECGRLIEESVNSRLISDVPTGVFLSGGIDSSLIAYYANKNTEKLNTYSVTFNEKNFNEGNIAKKTSKYLNSKHQEFKFDSKIFFEFVNKLVDIYDEPFSDISQLPTTYLSYMVSRDVKVALSGDGGDEFFGGYKKYLWEKKIWNKLSWMNYDKRIYLGHFIKNNLIENNFFCQFFSKNFLTKLNQISKRLIKVKNNYDLYNTLISNLFYTDPTNFNSKNLEKINDKIDISTFTTLNKSEQMMMLDIMFTLSNGILCKLDRAAMHSSLETRLPFLNESLNKFSINLPLKYKINKNETKYLLKKLASQKYNNNHFIKNKMGFGIPINQWLKNDIKDWSKEIIFNGDKYNFFDNKFYRQAWENHQKGYDNSSLLWNNIIFNLWSFNT